MKPSSYPRPCFPSFTWTRYHAHSYLRNEKETGSSSPSQRLLGVLLGTGKNWPRADQRVLCNDPRNSCGRISAAIPLFQAKGVFVWENPRLHSWSPILWIHYDKRKLNPKMDSSVCRNSKLRNRTAGRRGRQNAFVRQTWQGYYLRVLSWPSLNINVFWLLQKDPFKGKWSLAKRFFETKLLPRLAHKVCRLRSSPILLRKFTNFGAKRRQLGGHHNQQN